MPIFVFVCPEIIALIIMDRSCCQKSNLRYAHGCNIQRTDVMTRDGRLGIYKMLRSNHEFSRASSAMGEPIYLTRLLFQNYMIPCDVCRYQFEYSVSNARP